MSGDISRPAARDAVRPLNILALLVIVAIGAAAASRAPAFSGVGVRRAGPVVTALSLVLLVAGAVAALAGLRFVLRIARRRPRGDDEPELVQERHETAWQRIGAAVTLLVALGLAAGLAFALPHMHFTPAPGSRPATVPSTLPTVPAATRSAGPGGGRTTAGGAVVTLAVVAGVVVFAAGGYLALRARRRHHSAGLDVTLEPAQQHITAEMLRDATAALTEPADARSAILACYRAMERSLAEVGASRQVADTPEELLDRAARSGVMLPAAAQRLAALFREARFSTHPMTSAHREDAAAALGAVQQALGRQR